MPTLFDPVEIGPLRLANRVVMAPMARARSEADRRPGPIVATYYAQRASAGLIVTEASHVSPWSVSRPGTSAQHDPRHRDGWAAVTAAVHAAGGRIFQQLYHVGRKAHPTGLPTGTRPVAPSAIAAEGTVATPEGLRSFRTPRALVVNEIDGIVEEFRRAARFALDSGFDGIELHGANGFLIDQFLRDGSNRRTDGYGGPVERRARLLLDVVDATAEVFGAGRIGVRLSPHFRSDGIGDSDPVALFGHVARALGARRIAYLHLIESAAPGGDHGPSDPADALAIRIRSEFGGPLILAGGYDLASARDALARGRADAIAFGRPFIANPDLVERLKRGVELGVPKPATFYEGGIEGYIDYPAHKDADVPTPA